MAERLKLHCPKCGATMNHHADKLVLPSDDGPPGSFDAALGGIIQETHTCPVCGTIEFRRAEPDV